MLFSEIPGNEDIKRALVGMADEGRVPHAIMFHENDGGGGLALALAFAQYLNCTGERSGDSCGQCVSCHQHSKLIFPDVHFSYPIATGGHVSGKVDTIKCRDFLPYWRPLVLENPFFLENELSVAFGIEKKVGSITVAEGQDLLRTLSLASTTDGYRTVIIYLPEKMGLQTANKLLKAIEEPSDRTVFLLVTHAPEDVLQTIASRCLRLRVVPLSRVEVASVLTERFGVAEDAAQGAAASANGSVGAALASLADNSQDKEFFAMFSALMDKIIARDFYESLDIASDLGGWPLREKQKAFCTFASEAMRKVFLLQQGLEDLAGIPPADKDFYTSLAGRCPKNLARRSLQLLSTASNLIERNVNQKIVFTNLVSGLFIAAR